MRIYQVFLLCLPLLVLGCPETDDDDVIPDDDDTGDDDDSGDDDDDSGDPGAGTIVLVDPNLISGGGCTGCASDLAAGSLSSLSGLALLLLIAGRRRRR